MPSDRDHRRRTPGGGIQAGDPPHDEHAQDSIQAIARRQHDTMRTASSTLTQVGQTLDQVGALRVEVGGRIGVLEERVNELAERTANMDGKLDILVDVSRERRQVQVAAVAATIEVEKTGQLAKIEQSKAKDEFRRTMWLKVTLGVGAVWALISSLILAGKC